MWILRLLSHDDFVLTLATILCFVCLAVSQLPGNNVSSTVRVLEQDDSLHYLYTKTASIDECELRFSNVNLLSGFLQALGCQEMV